jgi:hypothetical protein
MHNDAERHQIEYNINIGGDSVGGDQTRTGNISGTGAAVGRGASATITGSMAYMNDMLPEILRRLMELERRIMRVELDNEAREERDRHERSTVSSTLTLVIGGMIFVALVALVVFLASGGFHG